MKTSQIHDSVSIEFDPNDKCDVERLNHFMNSIVAGIGETGFITPAPPDVASFAPDPVTRMKLLEPIKIDPRFLITGCS
jgi:hypothetical protein